MKKPREKEYKTEGKQVLYFNGLRWLVKETCKNKKDADGLLIDLDIRKANGLLK